MDGLFPPEPAQSGPQDPPQKPGVYRVLARKYRPQSFDDLIGQEPMVRTLTNAFSIGRIAQGYMLTGVRGVGKTTTARILARALNYELPASAEHPAIDRPTIDMHELGIHCRAIMEGRHVDVIEMDAASHTGIGDIREIIEAVRYKPVSARMKVYVIDEVHMLSNAAFNGLLKTLEEPPEHVKFIFATTEIRKVPVTILSRCQRFDLRRIEPDVLVKHLRKISDAESVEIEDDALRLVARAAEGSVRDSLSLLDQAIAHGEGRITGPQVREMLGLADRARVIDLFDKVMRGDAPGAIAELRGQFDVGADPQVVIADLAEFTHFVTRLKLVPDAALDATASPDEVSRGTEFASGLSLRVLGRAWQILLKGFDEIRSAPKALSAAEMVLIRLAYAADLPTPDEALKLLRDGGSLAPGASTPGPAAGSTTRGGATSSAQGGATSSATGGIRSTSSAVRDAHVDALPSGAARMEMRTDVQKEPVARLVASNPEPIAAPGSAPAAGTEPKPAPAVALRSPINSLADIAVLAGERREIRLKLAVEREMRPVKFEPGRIEIALTPQADRDQVQELARKLSDWTGTRWLVIVSREEGGQTIAEGREAAQTQLLDDARSDPLVAAVMRRFPGARIVDVRVERSAEEEAARVVAAVPAGTGEDAGLDSDAALDDDIPAFETDDPGWLPEE